MIRFDSDYTEGAHERILGRILETNEEQTPGYGEDQYCQRAASYIKNLCRRQDADIHFLVGGTQANTVVIASALRPHQCVISARTGHINVHETGAIEAAGHKVLAVESPDGKVSAARIKEVCEAHWGDPAHEHMPQPAMVYISQPTENGTVYTKEELTQLNAVCRECGLLLYLDGARLGYALAAKGADLTIEDLARLCDVFYIGGTKVGALFGEAVVIVNSGLKKDFRYHIKQRGGMLAKGRLLGIQFAALFEDGLYFRISEHAVKEAMKIKTALTEKGIPFLFESPTNQQFPILPNRFLEYLNEKFVFNVWEKIDDSHTAVRICTSWATKDQWAEALIKEIDKYEFKAGAGALYTVE